MSDNRILAVEWVPEKPNYDLDCIRYVFFGIIMMSICCRGKWNPHDPKKRTRKYKPVPLTMSAVVQIFDCPDVTHDLLVPDIPQLYIIGYGKYLFSQWS